jgi:hypothetical protein
MECRDAQFYLRLRKHAGDELGPEVAAALDGHLAVCAACAAEARAAASFDRALASAMRAVPIPAGLRERLVSHVAGQQGGILRRRMYRASAAVAAALLLVGIGLGVFSSSRPKPDTGEWVRIEEDRYNNPEATTRRWLAAQKLPDTLPLPFDYDLFVTFGKEDFQGKDVPVIVFRSPSGPGFAKVYIFREDGLTDTSRLRDAYASRTQARVFNGEGAARNVKYVVVFTGLDLQPFLRNAGGPQPIV